MRSKKEEYENRINYYKVVAGFTILRGLFIPFNASASPLKKNSMKAETGKSVGLYVAGSSFKLHTHIRIPVSADVFVVYSFLNKSGPDAI